jgi:hypothetical protein
VEQIYAMLGAKFLQNLEKALDRVEEEEESGEATRRRNPHTPFHVRQNSAT